MIRLRDDPALVQAEIERRREAARHANPRRQREEELRREQARLEKSMERLINAYQEGLVMLAQLRQRMPDLRRQVPAVESELHSLAMAAVDEARYLQVAETLATFRGRLRARAETLDVRERQQILRLLVKEILVGSETITIRHSIPIPPPGSGSSGTPPPSSGMIGTQSKTGYLLRSGSPLTAAGKRVPALRFRSMGRGLARESGDRRQDRCPVRRRSRGGLSAPGGRRAVSEGVSGAAGEVRVGSSSGKDEANCVGARSLAKPETGRPGEARNVHVPWVHARLRRELERLFPGLAGNGREADEGQAPAEQAGVARSDARAG